MDVTMAPAPVAEDTGCLRITPPATPVDARIELDGGKHSFAHSLACAALADRGELRRVPDHVDAAALRDGLRLIFDDVRYDRGTRVLRFGSPRQLAEVTVPATLATRSRSLFCLYPALLTRAEQVRVVAPPQGCSIGVRPFEWYFDVLRQFGVEVEAAADGTRLRWPVRRPAAVAFRYPSMTGTVLAVAAAAASPGRSTITGASVEPSCADELRCLATMGAQVSGSLPDIQIESPGRFEEVRAELGHDRIHAVSYLVAGLLTRGRVTVAGAGSPRVPRFVDFLRATGCQVELAGAELTAAFPRRGWLDPVRLRVGSEPLFSSDWAPLATLLLATRSRGTSTLVDDVFVDRFQFADTLAGFGLPPVELGGTTVAGRPAVRAVVRGRPDAVLRAGTYPTCPDIRGSVAIALAALVADGPCHIVGDLHIRRGHTDLAGDLNRLGVPAERSQTCAC